jgi:uncharacterized membrane protein
MNLMDWWNLLDWLIDPGHHWVTAGILAVLAIVWTWIKNLAPFVLLRLIQKRPAEAGVARFAWLQAGLSAAVTFLLSLPVLNYGWELYSMPLDELMIDGLPVPYVLFWTVIVALMLLIGGAAVAALFLIYAAIREKCHG